MVRRAGDDVLGCDDDGDAGLEEPAMNLSRKCCSQSEDGMVSCVGFGLEVVVEVVCWDVKSFDLISGRYQVLMLGYMSSMCMSV